MAKKLANKPRAKAKTPAKAKTKTPAKAKTKTPAKAKSKAKAKAKAPAKAKTPAKPRPPAANRGGTGLLVELEPIYEAFCGWLGKDVVDAAVKNIEADTTPYLFFFRLNKQLPDLAAKLRPAAGDNILAWFSDPANDVPCEWAHDVEGEDWGELRGIKVVDYDDLSAEGRKALGNGNRLLTLKGDAVLACDDINGGNIWEIDDTKAIDHGSVESLIADLRARIS